MKRRPFPFLAAGLALICTAPAPASVKPCRDASGRVVQCPKVRKATPRCKDAGGRFIACQPSERPADRASAAPTGKP